MSSGNFEKSSYSPQSAKNDTRMGGLPRADYDRPPHLLDSRRSPSPGPSRFRPGYDRYVPAKAASDYPNVYRPDSWRNDRSYRPRTPSPDHYEPPRHAGGRARTNPWPSSHGSSWPDRRNPPSPVARNRGRRDTMAERMFEPSDAWKQTHVPGTERALPSDRHVDNRSRPLSPERPSREDHSSYHPSGDFYRPSSPSLTHQRTDFRYPRQSDTYRPQYDDSHPWRPSYTPEPPFNPVGINRREIRSPTFATHPSHGHSDHLDSRYLSRDRSVSSSPPSVRSPSPVGPHPGGSHWEPRYRDRSTSREYYTRSPSPPSSVEPRLSSRRPPRSRSSSCSSTDSRSGARKLSMLPTTSHLQSASYSGFSRNVDSRNKPEGSRRRKVGLRVSNEGLRHSSTGLSATSAVRSGEPTKPRKSRRRPRPSLQLPSHPSLPPRPASPAHITPTTGWSSRDVLEPPLVDKQKFLSEVTVLQGDDIPTEPPLENNLSLEEKHQDNTTQSPLRSSSPAVNSLPQEPSTEKASGPAEQVLEMIDQSAQLQVEETRCDETPMRGDSVASTVPPSPLVVLADLPTIAISEDPLIHVERADESNDQQHGSSPLSSGDHFSNLRTPSPPRVPPDVIVIPLANELQEAVIGDTVVDTSLKPVDLIVNQPPDQLSDQLPMPVVPSNFVPFVGEARSLQEALRVVVAARQQFDHQSREERVDPVLLSNKAIAEQPPASSTSPEALIQEMMTGERGAVRVRRFHELRPTLVQRISERQETVQEKTKRLRKEYAELHDSWVAHCALLDSQGQTNPGDEMATVSGRTTRRSAAVLGDAVRSDLEMEQIIASLGNEDLTDPAHLALRNIAVIPDMISVTHGRVDALFDDTNNLVENPAAFYDPSPSVAAWTDEEQQEFFEKFAAHPKQFGIIAKSLPHKSQAQCVQFYYMHKKRLIDFREVILRYAPGKKKRGGKGTGKKKGNALLADIRQHDAEVSKDTSSGRGGRRRRGVETRRAPRKSTAQTTQVEPTPVSTPTPDPEMDARPKRRRTAAQRTVPTSLAVEQEDADADATDVEPRPAKRRRGRKPKTTAIVASTPPESSLSEMKFIDHNESSARRKSTSLNVYWSDEDKSLFLQLLAQHGDDFKRIAASMPNKTTIQVNAFYKTNLKDMDLERVAAGAPKRSPTPENNEGWTNIPELPGTGIISPNASVTAPAEVDTGIQPSAVSGDSPSGQDTRARKHMPVSGVFATPVDGYTQILPRPQAASRQGQAGPDAFSLTATPYVWPQGPLPYDYSQAPPPDIPSFSSAIPSPDISSSATSATSTPRLAQGLNLRSSEDLTAYLGRRDTRSDSMTTPGKTL